MGFPGVWMNMSETLVYRVVPKCGCSTIGQILYRGDNGAWYDGDIHDARTGLHKWGEEASRPAISARVTGGGRLVFTCVRNPYSRILSCFFDKVCAIQRNGRRYRANLLPGLLARYGVGEDPAFDQVRAFRRFLLFVRDTIRFGRPMEPDIHWSSCAGHAATLVANGGRYDRILFTETLDDGLAALLGAVPPVQAIDLAALPRFNDSGGSGPRREHPVEAYFDDLAIHMMQEIYRRDFAIFRYAQDPGAGPPLRAPDLDEINARLAR